MSDELSDHLLALARDECYRVDEVLKCGAYEKTELVYFVGKNGAEQGPYIRKYFEAEVGLGSVYDQLQTAQKRGRRFVHLPTIFDCYRMDNKRVVVMEFIHGETLDEVIYRCDPSLELAFDVFVRLCEAVEELHGAFEPCIIHRDLKPSNIMLTLDNVTIIDFGIARVYDQDAYQDTLHFGTRFYAPPEQFGFGQTDRRSDVYALGMLLYYCLTECTPDASIRRREFRDPAVPEALRQIILTASAFDPNDRYSSVSDLRQAVLRAKNDLATHSYAEAPQLVSPLWSARQKPSVPAESPDLKTGQSVSKLHAPSSEGAPLSPVRERGPFQAELVVRQPEQLSSGAEPESSQFHPLHPSQMQRPESSGRAKRRTWSSFVKKIGIAWDFLLGLVLAFLALTCIASALDPRANSPAATAPLSLRALLYAQLFFLVFLPGAVLICDRRPLRRFLPFLEKGLMGQFFVPLLIFIGGLVLVGLSAKCIGL